MGVYDAVQHGGERRPLSTQGKKASNFWQRMQNEQKQRQANSHEKKASNFWQLSHYARSNPRGQKRRGRFERSTRDEHSTVFAHNFMKRSRRR